MKLARMERNVFVKFDLIMQTDRNKHLQAMRFSRKALDHNRATKSEMCGAESFLWSFRVACFAPGCSTMLTLRDKLRVIQIQEFRISYKDFQRVFLTLKQKLCSTSMCFKIHLLRTRPV